MQVVVVAGLVVVVGLMEVSPAGAAAPPWVLLACAAGYVAVAYGATRWTASFGLRRLMGAAGAAGAGGSLGRWPAVMALGTRAFLVAAMAGLMLAGWGSLFDDALHLRRLPLVGKALASMPFVLALIAHWWVMYPLEQALRMHVRRETAFVGEPVLRGWSRRQYLGFNVRHHLLFVALPAAAIVGMVDVLILMEAAQWISETTVAAGALAFSGCVFLAAPAIIVRIWRARPLPSGPLRSRLEAFCRRTNLTCREIMVWDTHGVVVNAGVMGLLGRLRYVLLSDALLAHLDEDAVEAVFAHEVGHVVHRHIPYMVLFTCGLLLVATALGALLAAGLGADQAAPAVQASALLLAGVLWAVPFGALSRRFERQADVFAAAAVGGDADREGDGDLTVRGVSTFANALLAVARLNGSSRHRRSFRHGSICGRVDFLGGLLAQGLQAGGVDRRVRAIKLAVWVLFAVGVLSRLVPLLVRAGAAGAGG